MEETADRESPEAPRSEPELLAHLNGAESDTARVLFGVRVLLGETHDEGAYVRAEEGLFGRDELASAQITRERAGLDPSLQIEADRAADEGDPGQLEPVPDPPAELREVEDQRGDERSGKPGQADDDEEVGEAAGEQERVQRP